MEARVYAETDMLFSTLNNIGSQDFEGLGIKQTIIVVDEAGSSLNGRSCRTVDAIQHLGSVNPSREVVETTYVSSLETLIKFNVDLVFLDQQYRMASAIVHFPSRKFYGGKLRMLPSTAHDNNVRQQMRRVSTKYYRIQVPMGSEYLWIDVYKGESHPEEGGFTLQNSANADVITKLLENLNNEGIAPEDITILSMYKAQMRLVFLRVSPKLTASSATTRY